MLYGSMDEDVMPMFEAPDFFIYYSPRNPLHVLSFYNALKLVLTDLRALQKHLLVKHACFWSFMAVKLQANKVG